MRAQNEAARAEKEAQRARAAEDEAKANLQEALKGRALAAAIIAEGRRIEYDAPSPK
jgi:hypothetical protein